MTYDLVVLTSPEEVGARFAVVERAQLIDAAEMLRQVGSASASVTLDVKREADRRANAVIAETAGAGALAAFAPGANVFLENAIVATGIVRIARIYGVALTRKEAGKFLKEMVLALGVWQATAIVGEKALASALTATGAGYVGAATLDSAVTAAEAVALCTAAKLYFGSDMKKGDLRRVVRSSFRQARKQFSNKQELTRLTTSARAAGPSFDQMSQVLQSRFGRNIIHRLALTTPLLAADLADYLQTTDAAAKALTPAALKRLDKETGLVRELWSLARSSVDIDTLVRLSAEPDSAFALLDRLGGLSGGGEAVALMPEPAAQLFVFPPGHPAPNVVYARHPLAQRIFYPLAQFHRLTFEHKVCEAVVLLQSLGARRLSVRHIVGMSADVTASVAAALRRPMTPPAAADGPPGPVPAGSAGSSGIPPGTPAASQSGNSVFAGARSSDSSEMLFEATYEGHEPEMPSGLVWYNHEPTWQHVAEARLHHGLTSFNLHVKYTDSFGIDARLASNFSALPGLGTHINLGGAFHDFEVTDWCISGSFSGAAAEDPRGQIMQ